jgi:hypothetical protein
LGVIRGSPDFIAHSEFCTCDRGPIKAVQNR